MAAPFSSVQFNTREEALTSDLNRVQQLASRELQNLLRDETNTQPSFPGYAGGTFADVEFTGSPISGSTLEASLSPSGAFDLVVGPGQAMLNDTSVSGADNSTYEVLRWPAPPGTANTTLTLATPDATNPRIDLIIATPGTSTTDLQSRNILLDPVARTVAPANVPKTAYPIASLSVITGTPAGSPSVPAVPSGSVALFEVYIPASAASSASFQPVRRLWRRATFPVSTMHGIMSGCRAQWTLVDETAASSVLITATDTYNRAVINGEVLQWGPNLLNLGVFQDAGAANPFGSAAPATNDLPYYIYLCGGRALPQLTNGTPAAPVCIVESLTAPDAAGYPSSAITTPRGTTRAGALYIGIGFVVQNTTRRKGCYTDQDWVYALSGQMPSGPFGAVPRAGFNDGSTRTLGSSAVTSFTLAAKPSVSTRALLVANYNNSAPSSLFVGSVDGANIYVDMDLIVTVASTPFIREAVVGLTGPAYFPDAAFATGTLYLFARGYNMHVPRLSP